MGTTNSTCQGCFGDLPSPLRPDPNLMKRPAKYRTCESTVEDLDKLNDSTPMSGQLESYASFDDIQNFESIKSSKEAAKLSLKDFNLIKTIGYGSFGKSYLVQKRADKKRYVLKVMKKKDLAVKNLLSCVLSENNILEDLRHPFVVEYKSSFQTNTRAYIVTEYCSGGNLATKMKKERRFDEKTIKYYAAELILALEYLHEKLDIVHRDFKPENILISADGHLKISNFGLAKRSQALSFSGSLDYLAPEIVWGRPYGQAADWWGLGCLIYQMLTGNSPFYHENRDKLFSNILTVTPKIESCFSDSIKNLLLRLLNRSPKQRLGSKGAWEVKNHPFFKNIDWDAILNKEIPIITQLNPAKENIGINDKKSSVSSTNSNFNSQKEKDMHFSHFSFVDKNNLLE